MTGVMRFVKNLFSINPIIVKEIRSRMRGPRAFITLTLILLAMGGVMYGMLQIIIANARYSNILSPQIGQAMFAALAFLELFMICAITPAVTAGAISGEKEKQTYEMLMATPLSPTRVLWGKLISALSYVLLLLFAGVPLASVVFIFGGVALQDMLRALIVLIGFAVAFGILGLFMSALFGRTGRATVASFILVVLLMVGPLFVAGLVGVMRNGEPPRWLLAPSPISALSAALASSMGNNAAGSVFMVLGGIFNMGVTQVSQTSIPRPLYHYTIPFYLVLSVVMYMLSTRLVRPTRRWRLRKMEWALGLGSLLLLIGVIAAGYYTTAARYEWAVPAKQQDVQTLPAMAVPVFQGGPVIQKEIQVVPAAATPTPVDPPSATPTAASTLPPTSDTVSTALVDFDDGAKAEIYALILKQLIGADNTFGGKDPGWKNLYIVMTTSDSIGDPNTPKLDPIKLSLPIQEDVTTRIKDTGMKIAWVVTNKDVPLDPSNGAVDQGKGVIATLGNLHLMKDGSVQVPASIYFGGVGGAGKTYILTKVDGVWKITGKTAVEWIS